MERFIAESRLAASLSHPNVIPVFDAGEDDGLLYIVMQYVDGLDLAQWLSVSGTLDAPLAATLLAQVAGALDAAHDAGLLHRDVKPANILIVNCTPEHAFLADFGLARPIGVDDAALNAAGTVSYMAPEALAGAPLDRRADVYGLAAVAFHCLTGTARRDEDARGERRPALPAAVDVVLTRGLAAAPGERYATAGAFAADLRCALGLAAAPVVAPSPVELPLPGAPTEDLE